MNTIVKIPENLYEYIEKLYYEYEATLAILTHLMNQETIIQTEILNKISERCEQRFIELEIAKEHVVNEYKPEGKYTYTFNFIDSTIEFIKIKDE